MEDSRKGKKDGEKELSTPSPHVDDEKGKKAIVYKTKKGEGKGMSEDTHCLNYAYSSSLFTLKPNILAQDSD